MGKKLELMEVNFWNLPNFNFLAYQQCNDIESNSLNRDCIIF